MDSLVQLIIPSDITDITYLTVIEVVVRLIIVMYALETFGVVCGHIASVGR